MDEKIDIRQCWKVLRKRWRLLATIPLIAAITSGVISFYIIEPVYQASATLIVGKKASGFDQGAGQILDYNVLLANLQLAKTYATIAKSRSVEQNVIQNLGLSMAFEDFNKQIFVNPVKNTDVLEIQVRNPSPELAASIANSMAQEFSKAVIEVKKVDSISIVDHALIPDKPVRPKKVLNVMFAFLVGLLATIGLIFLLEYLDTTIKTGKDAAKLLGSPVLGLIPNYQIEKHVFSLFTLKYPQSLVAEAYRTLRTNLDFNDTNLKVKKVVITSTDVCEGKSFTVANLAVSLAQAGKNVLVIDANLRNPSQHKIFRMSNAEGLTVVLLEGQDYRDYLQETNVSGLKVMPVGPIPPNPADIVGSQPMKRLLGEVGGDFDMVIIDTPPIIDYTDAAILAREADGVALVLASGEVNLVYAQRAKELLDQVGAKILGGILTKVDMDYTKRQRTNKSLRGKNKESITKPENLERMGVSL